VKRSSAAAAAPADTSSLRIAAISGCVGVHPASKSFRTMAATSDKVRNDGMRPRGGGAPGSRPSRAYPSRVERPKAGRTMTAWNGTFHGRGVTRSPNPSTSAAPPDRKNGTSAPTRAAISSNVPAGGCFPVRAISPFSVAAASELPPPNPDSVGIAFRIRIRAPAGTPAHARKRAAALWQLFAASPGTPGASHSTEIPEGASSTATSSYRVTGTMTERMWWYPSGRFPNTWRERFNFAGARKETADVPTGCLFKRCFQ